MQIPVKAVALAVKFLPKIKGAIFADGKFSLKRAIILLVSLAILVGSIWLIGVDNTIIATDILDDISDSIGYEE